jgi:hypothetical protein
LWARSVLATTNTPDVSLSRRCTMPGRLHTADAGERVAAMIDQRVDQRAGPVARAGRHHQPGRLVDDDQRCPRTGYPTGCLRLRPAGSASGRTIAISSPSVSLRFGSVTGAPTRLTALLHQRLDTAALTNQARGARPAIGRAAGLLRPRRPSALSIRLSLRYERSF